MTSIKKKALKPEKKKPKVFTWASFSLELALEQKFIGKNLITKTLKQWNDVESFNICN